MCLGQQVKQEPADMGNQKDIEYPEWLEGTWKVHVFLRCATVGVTCSISWEELPMYLPRAVYAYSMPVFADDSCEHLITANFERTRS